MQDAVAALEVVQALSTGSDAVTFATCFVDSYVVDGKDNLVRDSLTQAAAGALKHAAFSASLKEVVSCRGPGPATKAPG